MILLLFTITVLSQHAREVLYDPSQSIEIHPAVSDPARHITCVVTLPEESIETLVAAWNETDISIERKRDHLFIKLFRSAEGDIHVLGASGALYRLYIRPPPENRPSDSEVRIVRPATLAKRTPAALELMRAMRLAQAPEAVSVRRAPDRIAFRTDETEARTRWVYESVHHLGYVVEISNTSDGPVHVDPRRFSARDLVLVGAREHVLPPNSKTFLYFVFWR